MNFLSIYKRFLFIAVVAVLALRCAQPTAPTGGERDSKPPEVLSVFPKNETVNFNSQTIEIEFDEYIQLKDPINQILVSPSLDNKPEFTLKKKSLIIELKDTLRSNTTYSINFGQSIVDNNEGNVLKNFVYAFSTGAQLDSQEISGKVRDAYSGAPVENMKVQLFMEHTDSIPYLEKPSYFVQTDENGSFKIQYLPKTTFKIFGCSDENENLIYDEAAENICFLDSLINLAANEASVDSIILTSFNEEKEFGYLDKLTSDTLGVYSCTFSVPQKDVKLASNSSDSIPYVWTDQNRTTLNFFSKDTGELIVSRTDLRFSNSQLLKDTAELKENHSTLASDYAKNCRIEFLRKKQENQNIKLDFRTSKPLDSASILVHVKQNDSLVDIIDSISIKNQFQFGINYACEPEISYDFIILPNSLSAGGYTNGDSTKISAIAFPPNHFGEIVEWIGFAILSWSLPAFAFAIWTMANLVPRSLNHHQWNMDNWKLSARNKARKIYKV